MSLHLKNIGKSFGGTKALSDINLDIPLGEFIVLVGPSGCGKSTLLGIISGLETSFDGQLFYDNQNITQLAPKDRDIAMVFQSYALYPNMTVRENIAFGLSNKKKISKTETEEIVQRVAKSLHLEELLNRKPSQLSGGQRQRVAMGRAISRNPKIFLFDEPLSNLDANLRVVMRQEIKQLHLELKTTVIYVTHDQTEAMSLADRIVVMNKGQVQQIGTPLEIYYTPNNIFVAQFIGIPSINLIPITLEKEGREFELRTNGKSYKIPVNHGYLKGYVGKEVVLGIRSEHAEKMENGKSFSAKDIVIKARVDFYEKMGADNFAFIKVNDQTVIARSFKPFEEKVGDEIEVNLLTSKAMFFDKETGKRIH